ncbi:MAG: GIY-YIG nuclease family protein [Cyanobacteria bacterium P01_H01_bin.105]
MRESNHPNRWTSVRLEERTKLPQTSGVYAVINRRKIYYIGFSTNLNRRWRGKGHHRFAQADRLRRPSLHYLPLPKQHAKTLEKVLIARYSPPWNYSKIPTVRKVDWMQRVFKMVACLLVLLIATRSLVLGIIAAAIAILLFH